MSHERIASTFDQWAADGRDQRMEQGHGDVVRQVVAQLGVRPGEQILDLGCGNGWATRLLAKTAPGVGAVGVDASPRMIARAEELHSLTIRARYEVGKFEALDFPDKKFDRVFSMEALYYAVDLPRALAEILRVLKPRGVADVVVDYFTDSPATAEWPAAAGLAMNALSQADWHKAFERAGFTEVRTQRVHDTRGPGERSDFQSDECVPDFEAQRALHEAGSLWIHGRKP